MRRSTIKQINEKNIARAKTFKIGQEVTVSDMYDKSYWKATVLDRSLGNENLAGWKGNLTLKLTDNSGLGHNNVGYYDVGTTHTVLSSNVYNILEEFTEQLNRQRGIVK